MSALAVALLLAAASLALLVVPVVSLVGLPRAVTVRGFALAMLQLLPVVLAVAYVQYAETHSRIPLFGYGRPPISLVFGAVALVQVVASALVVWPCAVSAARKSIGVAAAAIGAVGLLLVATGVVACANGNCF